MGACYDFPLAGGVPGLKGAFPLHIPDGKHGVGVGLGGGLAVTAGPVQMFG